MFNRQDFAASIETRCARQLLSLRQAAAQSGVSPATLGRLLSGTKTPDMHTFGQICAWLEQSPGSFFTENGQHETESLPALAHICAFLRADPTLPETAREALVDLMKTAYRCFVDDASAPDPI